MRRRQALHRLAGFAAVSAWPPVRGADAPKRIGILAEAGAEPGKSTLLWEPEVWALLAQRGWIPGQTVVVERALADTRSERLPRLAESLVSKRPDLILCLGDQEAMIAAARATQRIPILVFDVYDPVEQGLIETEARPGRNVTGISLSRGADLSLKRLQYLRAIAPDARRLAWLWGHDTSLASRVDGSRYDVAEAVVARARGLQFETRVHHVTDADEIARALAEATRWGAQAISAGGLPTFLARRQIVDHALRQRLPSVFASSVFVQDGGLLSYGISEDEYTLMTRRWVDYIDRVLRGDSPARMPLIAADRFDLQVNARTAEALGLRLPPAILSTATLVR